MPKRSNLRRKKTAARKSTAKPRKLSLLQNIVKSIYSVFSVLPFVPDPVKKFADIVAGQFGVATFTKSISIPPVIVAAAASPYCVTYAFIIRSNAYVLKSNAGTTKVGTSSTEFLTNYRAIRPRTTTIIVSPQNKQSQRSGHYTVALFPFTNANSSSMYSGIDKSYFCDENWLSRAPIYRKSPATSLTRLTYRTPKSNTYLHMGVPLQEDGKTTVNDGVMMVVVTCTCDCRSAYGNFNADDLGVDVKLVCIGEALDYNGTSYFSVWNRPLKDILKGKVTYHNTERTLWVDGKEFEYDEESGTMFGEVLIDLEDMEHDTKSP